MEKKLIFIVLLIVASFQLKGQGEQSYYFSPIAVQAAKFNPATILPYDYNMGFPLISNLNFRFANDALNYKRLIQRGADDSLRLGPSIFLSHLSPSNNFEAKAGLDLFSFGLHTQNGYMTMGIEAHSQVNLLLKKDLLNFIFAGPGNFIGQNDFKGNSMDFVAYGDAYFGYAFQVNEKLKLGFKFKLLNGFYHLQSKNLDMRINVIDGNIHQPVYTPYSYDIQMGGQVNTNLDLGGILDSNRSVNLFSGGMPFFKNMGAGIDLGLIYQYSPELTLTFNTMNLGGIFWRGNARQYKPTQTASNYVFSGMTSVNLSNGVDLKTSLRRTVRNLGDSLAFKADTASYFAMLPVSLNLGASYTLYQRHVFGVLFHPEFVNSTMIQAVDFSYTYMLNQNFAISIDNDFSPRSALNFGLSLVGNLGPVQLHLSVDNLCAFDVIGMRGVQVCAGVNFVIGKSNYMLSRAQDIENGASGDQNVKYWE